MMDPGPEAPSVSVGIRDFFYTAHYAIRRNDLWTDLFLRPLDCDRGLEK